jgi:hypothetical protein
MLLFDGESHKGYDGLIDVRELTCSSGWNLDEWMSIVPVSNKERERIITRLAHVGILKTDN